MAIIKKATPGEMAAKRLQLIYTKAEQSIIREITRKRTLGLVDYADVTALNRVQEILRNMVDESGEYIPIAIKDPFYKAGDLESAPYGYYNAQALSSAQTAIVERLVDNLLADIEEAANKAYESAEEYLSVGRLEAGELRNLTLELAAQREAEGKGWNTIQNKMAAELTARGITSFVDKAGRKWNLSSYCAMATRTTGRQAQVAAALTADDWDLWQISKIGSTCPLCSVYEGRVYSKSGTDPDYPPLAMAFGKIDTAGSNDLSNTWLNIHPNCLHALVRYTTAGKTDEQIQRDKDFSSFAKRPANVDYRSKKQIAAYRDKEKARAAFRLDMKQFKKYQAALGNEMPKTFETFMKHKKAGDEVYKEWEEKFRTVNRIGSEFLKNHGLSDIISLDQILVERNPAISAVTTVQEMKEVFPNVNFDASLEKLPTAVRVELAHGLNYVRNALGEEYMPRIIKVAKLKPKTSAIVDPAHKRITLNSNLKDTDALLSIVHESVHIADKANGDIAQDVLREALRKTKVRVGSGTADQVIANTMGPKKWYDYRKDPSELLAWCFEKSLRNDKNEFSEAVKEALLRRCRK